MKILTITWQRLVDKKGQTCSRCRSTGEEVRQAVSKLDQTLSPLGIKVTLEKKALDPATCAKDVSQSNRIWVAGRPLEEWLKARVGKSPCDTCCDELGSKVECRTIELEGKTYEAIPEELIIKAGLLAASHLITAQPKQPCYSVPTSKKTKPGGCCPKPGDGSKKFE